MKERALYLGYLSGGGLTVAGIALLSVPLAFIVAGVLVFAVTLLIERGGAR